MLLLQNDLGKKEVQAFLNISISGGRSDPNLLNLMLLLYERTPRWMLS